MVDGIHVLAAGFQMVYSNLMSYLLTDFEDKDKRGVIDWSGYNTLRDLLDIVSFWGYSAEEIRLGKDAGKEGAAEEPRLALEAQAALKAKP